MCNAVEVLGFVRLCKLWYTCVVYVYMWCTSWLGGSVVERWSLTGEPSLACT